MDDTRHSARLRDAMKSREVVPFIGVDDIFLATLAANHYGLPAIAKAMMELVEDDGELPAVNDGRIGVAAYTEVLRENLTRRGQLPGARKSNAPRRGAARNLAAERDTSMPPPA